MIWFPLHHLLLFSLGIQLAQSELEGGRQQYRPVGQITGWAKMVALAAPGPEGRAARVGAGLGVSDVVSCMWKHSGIPSLLGSALLLSVLSCSVQSKEECKPCIEQLPHLGACK